MDVVVWVKTKMEVCVANWTMLIPTTYGGSYKCIMTRRLTLICRSPNTLQGLSFGGG